MRIGIPTRSLSDLSPPDESPALLVFKDFRVDNLPISGYVFGVSGGRGVHDTLWHHVSWSESGIGECQSRNGVTVLWTPRAAAFSDFLGLFPLVIVIVIADSFSFVVASSSLPRTLVAVSDDSLSQILSRSRGGRTENRSIL